MGFPITIKCSDGNYELFAWQKLYAESDTMQLMLKYSIENLSELSPFDQIQLISKRLELGTEIIPLTQCSIEDFDNFMRNFICNQHKRSDKTSYILDFLNIIIRVSAYCINIAKGLSLCMHTHGLTDLSLNEHYTQVTVPGIGALNNLVKENSSKNEVLDAIALIYGIDGIDDIFDHYYNNTKKFGSLL